MKCVAFELVENRTVEPVDPDTALGRRRQGDGAFWFDVHSYGPGELEAWIEHLDLPPILTRIGLGGGPLQMVSLPHHAHTTVTTFTDEDGAGIARVGALVSADVLVTFHDSPLGVHDPVRELLDDADADDLSPSRLLILFLLLCVQHTQRIAMRRWETQAELDERVNDDVANVRPEEIRAQKLSVGRLAEVSESQTESFEFLAGSESDALAFSQHPGNVAQLVATARSMRRLAERLDKAAADLRKDYEVHQQQRMTRRLDVLTVIMAIFTPLTLLSGIWGMNFENMPGLSTTYGYAFALGLMALIAFLLLRYFRRTGWLD